MERFRFNTAISKLQVLTNEMRAALDAGAGALDAAGALAQMLAPFAPYAAEELWREVLGNGSSVHVSSWPSYDPSLAAEESVTLIVQVDGKVRDKIEVPADARRRRRPGARPGVRGGATGDRRARDREGDRPRPEARELRHEALTFLVGVTPVTEGPWAGGDSVPRMSIRERLDSLSRGELAGLVIVVVATLLGAALWYTRSLPASGRHRGAGRRRLARRVAGHRRHGVALAEPRADHRRRRRMGAPTPVSTSSRRAIA